MSALVPRAALLDRPARLWLFELCLLSQLPWLHIFYTGRGGCNLHFKIALSVNGCRAPSAVAMVLSYAKLCGVFDTSLAVLGCVAVPFISCRLLLAAPLTPGAASQQQLSNPPWSW